MGRTTWRYDPITEIEGFSEFTSYGDWESPNDRDCYILASDIPSENLSEHNVTMVMTLGEGIK